MAHAPQADIIDHDTGAAILKQVAVKIGRAHV